METTTANKNITPDEVVWINNYFAMAGLVNKDNIDSVLYFSLLWNMFEGIVCSKNATIAVMERAVKNLDRRGVLRQEDFKPYLEYFVTRYTTEGTVNPRFAQLNFRHNDREQLVKDVLEGVESDLHKVVLAILIIVYRYRNNLFHGEKAVERLQDQVDNFKTANRVLMTFMDRHR